MRFFLFFLLVSAKLWANSVTIQGRVTDANGTKYNVKVFAIGVLGDKPMANGILNEQGQFKLFFENPRQGFYKLRIDADPLLFCEFVVGKNSGNTLLTMEESMASLKENKAKMKGSVECDVYYEFRDLTARGTELSLIDSLSFYKNTHPANAWEAKVAKARGYQEELRSFISKHKGTYTADFMAQYKLETIPTICNGPMGKHWQSKHFLENISLNDRLIENTKELLDKIKSYQRVAFGYTYDDCIEWCKQTLAFTEDKYFKSLLFELIMRDFKKYSQERELDWMIKEYEQAIDVSLLTESSQDFITAMKVSGNGLPIEDISLPNAQGLPQSLLETCKGGKVTLLFAWRSSCSHCHEFLPVAKKALEDFKAKGFNIYGICFEKNQDDFKNAMAANQIPWTNVWTDSGTGMKTLAKRLPFSGTPYVALLDTNGKPILRMFQRVDLDAILKQILK